jgi:hypothetical protein
VAEHLAWSKGGTASFLTVADDAVTLRSSTPSPPGSRIEATLVTDPPAAVKIKIHGSKLEPDGSFTLKGRLLDANRALRARLAALVAPPSPPSS